jgi:hypothetical protein
VHKNLKTEIVTSAISFLAQRNTKKIHVFKLLFTRTSPPSFNRSTPLGLPHTVRARLGGGGCARKNRRETKKKDKNFFFRENPKKSGKRSRSLSRQRDVAEEGRRRYFFSASKKTVLLPHLARQGHSEDRIVDFICSPPPEKNNYETFLLHPLTAAGKRKPEG